MRKTTQAPLNACVNGEVASGERGTGLVTRATVDRSPATSVDCLEVLAVVFVAVMISNVGTSCFGGGGGGFDAEVEALGCLLRLLAPGSRGSPREERDSSLKFGSVVNIFQLNTALGGRIGVSGDNFDAPAFSSIPPCPASSHFLPRHPCDPPHAIDPSHSGVCLARRAAVQRPLFRRYTNVRPARARAALCFLRRSPAAVAVESRTEEGDGDEDDDEDKDQPANNSQHDMSSRRPAR